jgi:hypothetical protein
MHTHAIGMQLLDRGLHAREAMERLRDILDCHCDDPDGSGVFAVHVEADSFEDALNAAWDAMAAAGADDHLVFIEHADIPEHWKARTDAPVAPAE